MPSDNDYDDMTAGTMRLNRLHAKIIEAQKLEERNRETLLATVGDVCLWMKHSLEADKTPLALRALVERLEKAYDACT